MGSVQGGVRLDHDVYNMLKHLSLLLDDCDRHFYGEFGLSSRQYWTLHHLSEHQQSLSMVDISRLLLTDKSNVTAIIDRLEKAGYVKRIPSQQDRRMVMIQLTPAGSAFLESVRTYHDQRIHELLSVLDDQSLQTFFSMMAPVKQSLEAYLGRTNPVTSDE
jgi:DNA-binding MarR family transcriptional regulator